MLLLPAARSQRYVSLLGEPCALFALERKQLLLSLAAQPWCGEAHASSQRILSVLTRGSQVCTRRDGHVDGSVCQPDVAPAEWANPQKEQGGWGPKLAVRAGV